MPLLSVRHEFSDAWYRFLHPADGDTEQALELELDEDSAWGGHPMASFEYSFNFQNLRTLTFTSTETTDAEGVENIFMVLYYTAQ